MPEETVTLSTADGAASLPASAEIARHGTTRRALTAAALVVAGLAGGAACIIVPVVHLVSTWGFPLLGIFLAYKTWQTPEKLVQLEGKCPACGEAVELFGGGLSDERTCPNCKATLRINAPE